MNHLTNLYKHKCEQLQEQIYRLTRMINEADAPGPTQFPQEFQPPLLAPADFQVPREPPTRNPKPQPPVYNPSEKTYKDWLRNHPEPSYDPQDMDERYDAHERWEKERDRAEQYYRDRQSDDYAREYYKPSGQGVIRALDNWQKQVIPSELNPFW